MEEGFEKSLIRSLSSPTNMAFTPLRCLFERTMIEEHDRHTMSSLHVDEWTQWHGNGDTIGGDAGSAGHKLAYMIHRNSHVSAIENTAASENARQMLRANMTLIVMKKDHEAQCLDSLAMTGASVEPEKRVDRRLLHAVTQDDHLAHNNAESTMRTEFRLPSVSSVVD